jgi:hypothetical protein
MWNIQNPHLNPTSMIEFLNSKGENLGKPDSNGKYVYEYITLFSDYKLDLK